MMEWFNSNELFEILVPKKDENKIKEEITKLIKLIDIKENSKVCDFASRDCEYSIELSRRGFKVTAVDSIKTPLERVSKFCKKENIPLDISVENLRNFARSEYFDIIINFAFPFCFFEGDDDFRVLKNLVRSLKFNGKLFLRLIPKELFIKRFCGKEWLIKEKKFILKDTKIIENWSIIETRWIFLDSKKREIKSHFKMYSALEISSMVRQSGIEDIKIFGDLEGNPYDENAKELFLLATRK
uniref:Methyltransferase domain-containing protein n=1 Tax=candidate division WOR-3 bacterium TaxID=2052148 RepID=A0A7C4Y4R7_UNCW3